MFKGTQMSGSRYGKFKGIYSIAININKSIYDDIS